MRLQQSLNTYKTKKNSVYLLFLFELHSQNRNFRKYMRPLTTRKETLHPIKHTSMKQCCN